MRQRACGSARAECVAGIGSAGQSPSRASCHLVGPRRTSTLASGSRRPAPSSVRPSPFPCCRIFRAICGTPQSDAVLSAHSSCRCVPVQGSLSTAKTACRATALLHGTSLGWDHEISFRHDHICGEALNDPRDLALRSFRTSPHHVLQRSVTQAKVGAHLLESTALIFEQPQRTNSETPSPPNFLDHA